MRIALDTGSHGEPQVPMPIEAPTRITGTAVAV